MDKPVREMTVAELADELVRGRPDFEDEVSALGEDLMARLAADQLATPRRRYLAVESELLRRGSPT